MIPSSRIQSPPVGGRWVRQSPVAVPTEPQAQPRSTVPHAPLAALAALLFGALTLFVIPSAEWGSAILYLVVVAVAAFFLYQIGIKRVDPTFPGALFTLALLAKLIASVGRYWMIFTLYDGGSDTPLYHEHGQILAQYFRHFDFSIISTYQVRGEGTTMLAVITGLLYSILPVSMAGAFFFFAGLAFAGTVFCYRAARVAWPTADLRIFTLMLFFMPSVLFWPASLGKDAWILCWSGLVVWGWASFLCRGNALGLIWILLALLMLQLVRPHVAAFAGLAMGAAYLLYSTRGQRSVIAWFMGGVIVLGLAIYMVQAGASFLKLEDLSFDSLQERMTYQQQQTTQGGSRFDAVSIFSPVGLLYGLVTATLRPFPWEANSRQMLVISVETLGWLAIAWTQRKKFFQRLRGIRGDPVGAYALVFAIVMLLALTSFGNFGIVARYRVMAFPFLWMLFI